MRYSQSQVASHRRALVEALRSGEYDQCKFALKKTTPEGREAHCILGVACDVYRKLTSDGEWVSHGTEESTGAHVYRFEGSGREVQRRYGLAFDPYVADFFGMRASTTIKPPLRVSGQDGEDDATSLLGANDWMGVDFEELARIIEEHGDRLG